MVSLKKVVTVIPAPADTLGSLRYTTASYRSCGSVQNKELYTRLSCTICSRSWFPCGHSWHCCPSSHSIQHNGLLGFPFCLFRVYTVCNMWWCPVSYFTLSAGFRILLQNLLMNDTVSPTVVSLTCLYLPLFSFAE